MVKVVVVPAKICAFVSAEEYGYDVVEMGGVEPPSEHDWLIDLQV